MSISGFDDKADRVIGLIDAFSLSSNELLYIVDSLINAINTGLKDVECNCPDNVHCTKRTVNKLNEVIEAEIASTKEIVNE